MKYKSVFEIIGPVMVGPSSSHTAGAVRIGQIAGSIFGSTPEQAHIYFYGSFAETYRGHATDVAVAAGILGFETDDPRVKSAIHLAKEMGIDISFYKKEEVPDHPNTVKIVLEKGAEKLEVIGISIGGGTVHITGIDGFRLNLSGEHPSVLIFHRDIYGMVAAVAGILAEYQVNIGHMEVSRREKGKKALMVIETDEKLDEKIISRISGQKGVEKCLLM